VAALPDELRLLYVVLLGAGIYVCAYRFARRWGSGDRLQAVIDAYVLTMAVQYVAVCLPGIIGLMHWLSIGMVSIIAAGGLWFFSRADNQHLRGTSTNFAAMSLLDRAVLIACAAFLIGYVGKAVHAMAILPMMASDSLTYHAPAAVQWLQTGWLGLYEVWFYNPANTYSPLAGSVFMAWLMAPMGNDVLAKFVQAPALLFLFVAVLQLCRAIGINNKTAAVIGLATVLSRPFFSQAIVAKDDLFIAVFCIAALTGLSGRLLRDPLGPWRVGIALALFFATKYTALFSVPILFLAADAPLRAGWRWRHWSIAIACITLLAGPWFIRNIIITGNPLYPTQVSLFGVTILPGMFTMLRSDRLGMSGIWPNLTQGYFALPPIAGAPLVAYALLAGWLAAAGLFFRQVVREPIIRAILVGSFASILLYALKSPYGEMRFIYPSLALLHAACALAVQPLGKWGALVVLPLTLASIGTATAIEAHLWSFVATGGIVCAAALAAWGAVHALARTSVDLAYRAAAGAGLALILLVALLVYVNWPAYIAGCRDLAPTSWASGYDLKGETWGYIWEHVPTDATIAYANTYFTYPLYGFEHRRRVVYAPTRPDVQRLHDLPAFVSPTRGEEIFGRITEIMMRNTDTQAWLRNLEASGAQYLLIVKEDAGDPSKLASPPELELVASEPQRFQRLHENEFAVIYRVLAVPATSTSP